jgi:hypothetical protein
VVDFLFKRVLREVGAEELKWVKYSGAVEGSDRAAVGGAKDACIM